MRIRSLDGLRAFSILLVIAGHLTIVLADQHPQFRRGLQLATTWASTGVAVFFGISGFIITTLLLREQAHTGRIRLGAFYIRRAFRILPPLWALLVGVAILPVPTPLKDFGRAFLFLTDYFPAESWSIGHTWSLSVEEQFYLIWPLTLAALGVAPARWVAWAMICASLILRVLTVAIAPLAPLTSNFHLIADAIMVGCLVALLAIRDPAPPLLRLLRHDALAAISGVYLLVGMALIPRWSRIVGFDLTPYALSVRSFAVASVLVWSMANPDRFVGRILNWPVVTHVGILSYSLYLWQQPFFDPSLNEGPVGGWWVLRLVGAFAAAEISHRLIERPALALRDRWFSDAKVMQPDMTSRLEAGEASAFSKGR